MPKGMELASGSAEQTAVIGKIIGERLNGGDVIVLEGALGAGKTALAKGIAQGLGIDETVTSPTFTLISEYEGRIRLYHMDVYRLEGAEDFIALGAEELLYGEGACVIEWGEKIAELIPENAIIIKIKVEDDGVRRIALSNWDRGGFEGIMPPAQGAR